MNWQLKTLTGKDINSHIPDLARLRMEIFRSFPYLYDGDMAYEEQYLSSYLKSDETVMVLVLDAGRVVGASSGMPLAMETEEIQRPFLEQGMDPARVFYLGESLLQPDYRGHGLGHVFFNEREAHARRLGHFRISAFFAVQRPADHPLRPANYRPLDPFWRKRGYLPRPDMMTRFSWKDIGDKTETEKPMMFWLKQDLW